VTRHHPILLQDRDHTYIDKPLYQPQDANHHTDLTESRRRRLLADYGHRCQKSMKDFQDHRLLTNPLDLAHCAEIVDLPQKPELVELWPK